MTTLHHQFHRLAEAIDQAGGLLITAGAGIAVIIGCGVLYNLRQRRLRRREPHAEIPNFLRSGPDALNNPGSSCEVDCLEVYWTRRKTRRCWVCDLARRLRFFKLPAMRENLRNRLDR